LLRIWRATLNSWAGLKAAASSEAAFREEIVALVLAVPLALFFTPLAWKRLTLIGVILRAMVGPLGIAVGALVLLLIGGGLYLVLLRRPPRRQP